jgi:hypothetical protein
MSFYIRSQDGWLIFYKLLSPSGAETKITVRTIRDMKMKKKPKKEQLFCWVVGQGTNENQL